LLFILDNYAPLSLVGRAIAALELDGPHPSEDSPRSGKDLWWGD
jgi:hypothetical protein